MFYVFDGINKMDATYELPSLYIKQSVMLNVPYPLSQMETDQNQTVLRLCWNSVCFIFLNALCYNTAVTYILRTFNEYLISL